MEPAYVTATLIVDEGVPFTVGVHADKDRTAWIAALRIHGDGSFTVQGTPDAVLSLLYRATDMLERKCAEEFAQHRHGAVGHVCRDRDGVLCGESGKACWVEVREQVRAAVETVGAA